MERYILIGLRGTGKSTIGKKMAKILGIPFYDTDTLIEGRAGCTIPEIFQAIGEAGFREIERKMIASLPEGPAVIATGGGAVMDQKNAESLRKEAHIILLTADPEVLEARTMGTNRPPLTALSLSDEIRQISKVRMPVYRGLADICIDTGMVNADEAASSILTNQERDTEEGVTTLRRLNLDPDLIKTPLLFGITGNPVSHSRSPHLYNRLFSEYAIPGKYLFLPAGSADEAIATMQALGAKGLSVTIPFKEAMVSRIDEPDPDVTAIGALNTIVSCGGKLYGHNTDWIGIREPLQGHKGADALVVGAGGAAAAAVYALQSLDMNVIIANRTEERGRALARRFGCTSAPISSSRTVDLIINATPVGMKEGDGSPVPSELLRPGVTVFDLVYTPPMTRLLKNAHASGCTIIPGTELFIHQARAQFKLLTGIDPGPDRIREVLSS